MNRKSKAGRKPIGEKAMDDRLAIRLSSVEMQAVKVTAQEHGYGDVSKFIRGLLLGSPRVKQNMKQMVNR